MTTCICPGSFDPVTTGHLDIIERAANLYDEVVVAVLHNPDKQGTFPVDERVRLIEESLGQGYASRVRVMAFSNRLLVDVAAEVGAGVVVKGVRSETDFSYEVPMAVMNRHLTGLETVFLPAAGELQHVSSTLIRQVAAFGGDVAGMVPAPVHTALLQRFASEKS